MMLGMEEVMSDILIITNMKGNSKMEKLMEKEFIHGLMEKSMMENGREVSKKVMVYGKDYLEIHILENGKIVKQMGMEFILGRMATVMKGNGEIV